MEIAILGTGAVGRALAGAFTRAGHHVVVGTRDPATTREREGFPADLELATYADAAAGADVAVNATNGDGSLPAVAAASPGLAGKVLLDTSNPLDFSHGFPPTLTVKDTDSLAEQLQRAHPDVRVVKALNTCANEVMVDPGRIGDGDTTVFVAGDDADARAVARGLLEELGWRDVVEFDDLSAARGLEMWLPLWLRLMGKFGRAEFNLKIVR
ncbi:NADP oxidoreductase [Nocardioides guangzhouensis]|uniref:NADP oxidoreductase n=1 Tax=Nocardioides guangzhouensis TaxID=2497878 RepID=A0A4Q4ZLX3_9ACTN|nr:NAD(P)-binding domain-containing protein [Nocardioides guangzhouensis]RYP88611.1 NADP oxidoreductase [Nocardioides guangzhouensis]